MIKSNSKSSSSIRRLTIVGVLGAICAILGMTPIGFIPVGPTNATIMHIPVIIGAIIEGPIVGMLVGLIFGIFSLIRAITNPTIVSPAFYNPLVSILPRVLIGLTAYYSYVLFKKLDKKFSIPILFVVWLSTTLYLGNSFLKQIAQYSEGVIGLWSMIFSGALVFATLFIGIFSYKKFKNQSIEIVLSAAIGTLTNTIGVLGMIYVFYGKWFVEMLGGDPNTAGKIIIGIGVANGIPETIIAILIVTSVVMGMKKQSQ